MGDASKSAIGVAVIAALVSLLGLVISKEQKTSEFRQAWIDALRSEITAYLTSLNAIVDAARVGYESHAEKVKALAPYYVKLNEAAFSIFLRVNPAEDRSKPLIRAMREFGNLAANDKDLTPANVRPLETKLLSAAQELLKSEWKRVKRGEFTFVAAKFAASAFVIGALIAIALTFWRTGTRPARQTPDVQSQDTASLKGDSKKQ